MLDRARLVVGSSALLRQGNVNEALPIGDLHSSVDGAQATGVLEFAHNLSAVIDQVYGALKPNGVFAFTVESLPEEGDTQTDVVEFPEAGVTVYRHTSKEIADLLKQSGFSLLHAEIHNGYERNGSAVPDCLFLAQKQS